MNGTSVEVLQFGAWLRRQRKAFDLTQEDLALQAGCSRDAICKIELGDRRPSRQLAEILAAVLKVAEEDKEAFVQFARIGGARSRWFSESGVPTNLPASLTSFLGREQELQLLQEYLLQAHVRLLTLVGPPGIGKTRLGLEVARSVLSAYPDGVFVVNLAPISDPNLVIPTIAQTLNLKEEAGRPVTEMVKSYLRDKQMLLLLDNFEQVIEARSAVIELLTGTTGLSVLVTSRTRLQVRGEQEFSVPCLTLPPLPSAGEVALPTERFSGFAAVRLFIERAQSAGANLTVNDTNAPIIAEICRRLDGLPLAIELAAARAELLPPAEMLARLGSRLKLLGAELKDLPDHQRTLRAAIEWSFDLLSDKEKKLFMRMSVFVGGLTLEAVEAVCNVEGDLGSDSLEGVAALLDNSLLRHQAGAHGGARFAMLETINEFAREKLAEDDVSNTMGVEGLRRQHAHFFLKFAEEAEPQLVGKEQAEWFDRLEEEHDNLRAALQWSSELAQHADGEGVTGEEEQVLRLAGALGRFWSVRGYYQEGRDQLAAVLSLPLPLATDIEVDKRRSAIGARGKALLAAADLAGHRGDTFQARELSQEALSLYQVLGDRRGIAGALLAFATEPYPGNLEEGLRARRSLFEESLAVFEELGDKWNAGRALFQLGNVALWLGDNILARGRYIESLALFDQVGDIAARALVMINLGVCAQIEGDYVAARSYYEESLSAYQGMGHKRGTCVALMSLGYVCWEEGEYGGAHSLLEQGLTICRELGDPSTETDLLIMMGSVALTQGNYENAHALLSKALHLAQELDMFPVDVTIALRKLGHVAFREGDTERAAQLYTESLRRAVQTEHKAQIALALAGLAGVSATEHDPARAARLQGASQGLLEDARSARVDPDERSAYERNVAIARAQLGEEEWQNVWAEGQAMSMEEAVRYALEGS